MKKGKGKARVASAEARERAYRIAVSRFAHRPEVTGVDLGYKWIGGERTDVVALRIHVREKYALRQIGARERIPEILEGVPTDVIEAQYVPQNQSALTALAAPAAARPGTSIGLASTPPGTLGLLVRAQGVASLCVLSARHVLAPPNSAPGMDVWAPSPHDDAMQASVIARVLRRGKYTDSALAILNPGIAIVPAQYPSGIDCVDMAELLPRRLVDGDVSTLVDGHAARMEAPHRVMEWAGRRATGS